MFSIYFRTFHSTQFYLVCKSADALKSPLECGQQLATVNKGCLLCVERVSEGVTPFEAPFLNFVFALVKQIYSWSRLQLNAMSICSHQRKQYLDNEHHVQIGFESVRKEVKIFLKICIHIINDRVAEDLIWSEFF